MRFFGWGSGTLLSADGYILTNHHVTDVSDVIDQVKDQPNIKIREGELVVLLTKRSDQPAVATYIAEVVADSEDLDLAVLKITKDLSGKAVDSSALNLPYVELGDSDSIDLGDTINIFGYPGIGRRHDHLHLRQRQRVRLRQRRQGPRVDQDRRHHRRRQTVAAPAWITKAN